MHPYNLSNDFVERCKLFKSVEWKIYQKKTPLDPNVRVYLNDERRKMFNRASAKRSAYKREQEVQQIKQTCKRLKVENAQLKLRVAAAEHIAQECSLLLEHLTS